MVQYHPTAIETVLRNPIIVPGTGRCSHRPYPRGEGPGDDDVDANGNPRSSVGRDVHRDRGNKDGGCSIDPNANTDTDPTANERV